MSKIKPLLYLFIFLHLYIGVNAQHTADSLKIAPIVSALVRAYETPADTLNNIWFRKGEGEFNAIISTMPNKYSFNVSYKLMLLNKLDGYVLNDTTLWQKQDLLLNGSWYADISNSLTDSIRMNGKTYSVNHGKDNSAIAELKKKEADIIKQYFYYWYSIYKTYGFSYCVQNKVSCVPPFCKWDGLR